MFETLVSSRIRRALLEYILTHPTDHFYLRGLAKELGVSISPLRRELKRLEQGGVIRSYQEGNILFYTVNAESAVFRQLQQAGLPAAGQAGQPEVAVLAAAVEGSRVEPVAPEALATRGPGPRPAPAPAPTPVVWGQAPQPPPVRVAAAASLPQMWRAPLRLPALIGVAAAGIALMVIVSALMYVRLTDRELLARLEAALTTRQPEVTVVAPATTPGLAALSAAAAGAGQAGTPSAQTGLPAAATAQAGVMRGHRWQVMPGGFGGFSQGREAY